MAAAALQQQQQQLPKDERERQELEGVSSWLTLNSMRSERVQFELWCMHCAQNVWRKRAQRAASRNADAFWRGA